MDANIRTRVLIWLAVVIVVVFFGFVMADVRTDHLVRCGNWSADGGTTTTCICQSSDQLWHDTNCDRVKDSGEEFIDQKAHGDGANCTTGNYPLGVDADGVVQTCTAVTDSAVRRDLVNGTFVESFNALVTESGGVVSMTLEQSGTGDLTMQFSDGDSTLDCTPICSATLTAGSDTSPTENFVYVLQSSKALTVSTSDWPATEHIKVGYFLVPSAVFVAASGAYINQNWNDHISGTDNMGHLAHMADRSRRLGAVYFSGVDGNGSDGYLTPTASNVELISTAGVIYQMHKHAVPAFDTSGSDEVLVVNWSGDAYHNITNLFDITTDSTGATITNNKYFNLVFWSVGNKAGEYAPMMINLPAGFYNSQSNAENDVDGYDNFAIPAAFRTESSTGFLIARVTCQMKTTWVVTQTTDLRGLVPSSAAGSVGAVSTQFADNTFTIFDESDVTKVLAFQASGISTATTRTMTVPDASGTIALTSDIDSPTGAAGLVQYSDGSSGHDAEAAFKYTAASNTLDVDTYSFTDNISANTGVAEYSAATGTYMYGSSSSATYHTSLGSKNVSYMEANPTQAKVIFKKPFVTDNGIGGAFSSSVQVDSGVLSPSSSLNATAAGTTCGTGFSMTSQSTIFTTVGTGTLDYARMMACAPVAAGGIFVVVNNDSSGADTLNLCPTTGGNIGAGDDTKIDLLHGEMATCLCGNGDNMFCVVSLWATS